MCFFFLYIRNFCTSETVDTNSVNCAAHFASLVISLDFENEKKNAKFIIAFFFIKLYRDWYRAGRIASIISAFCRSYEKIHILITPSILVSTFSSTMVLNLMFCVIKSNNSTRYLPSDIVSMSILTPVYEY